ncbi:MAG: hypothetical protein MAGBODY4_01682 [Candidatus Marinimicrobia bacterium]|nr:hypothetical protein [Candidatus Neomarinimicrobiota bacterium]
MKPIVIRIHHKCFVGFPFHAVQREGQLVQPESDEIIDVRIF